jgi:THO complex subunit 4
LPIDVAEAEVEELFKRTIGPVKDLFIIYNNQARSKGMAVVTFHRPADAEVARSKYNSKVIDGKHKLKIELVTDGDEPTVQTTKDQSNTPPTLLSRIAGPLKQQVASGQVPNNPAATQTPQHPVKSSRISATPIVVSAPRKRTKKGPKRVKKSLAQLDQEMEEYRASATNGNSA